MSDENTSDDRDYEYEGNSNNSDTESYLDQSYDFKGTSSDIKTNHYSENKICDEEYQELRFPKKCAYCGIANPSELVMCSSSQKWFCNRRGKLFHSHIIYHLIKSRQNEVKLHKNSPVGNITLRCYTCGCKNVFHLGYSPTMDDSSIVIVCRHPCFQKNERAIWDSNTWEPLIRDRVFLSWIVKIPSETIQNKECNISKSQIDELEIRWETNPYFTIDDLKNLDLNHTAQRVKLSYQDAYEYSAIFIYLVDLEANYQRETTESKVYKDIVVSWEISITGNKLIHINLPKNSGKKKFIFGDKMKITGDLGTEWSGEIIKEAKDDLEKIVIQLFEPCPDIPYGKTTGFILQHIWNRISFDRMMEALDIFAVRKNAVSDFIHHKILGHDPEEHLLDCKIPENFNAPNLPKLNSSQIQACRTVLPRPLSLIQGPPGTGKTLTSATIVYHLAQNNKGIKNAKVLVCAPSNIAVDQLTEKIAQTKLKIVRVCAKSRESNKSSVDHLYLNNMIMEVEGSAEFRNLHKIKRQTGELSPEELKSYSDLKQKLETKVLSEADVISCTCATAGDSRISSMRFHSVLIDESTQATEPECLIPLMFGCRQAILVGDHCQLRPVITNKEADNAGLSQSLFERLVILGFCPIRLLIQYRMHPALSKFPSRVFYENTLKNGVSEKDRHCDIGFPWPNPDNPQFFYYITGKEELASNSTSLVNRYEAFAIEKIVTKLLELGVNPSSIGVITPYDGQRAFLVDHLNLTGPLERKKYEKIEVASVDSFQGREKDYILFTCVRAHPKQDIGFLKDPRRLNVAITRAKYGLIIVGNLPCLSRDPLWYKYLLSFQKNGLLVRGPLENLKISKQKLSEEILNCNQKSGTNLMNRATYTLSEYRNSLAYKQNYSSEKANSVLVIPELNNIIPNNQHFIAPKILSPGIQSIEPQVFHD